MNDSVESTVTPCEGVCVCVCCVSLWVTGDYPQELIRGFFFSFFLKIAYLKEMTYFNEKLDLFFTAGVLALHLTLSI